MAKATAEHTTIFTRSGLPSVSELPPAKITEHYLLDDLLRASVIPADDAALRALALDIVKHDTAGNHAPAGGDIDAARDLTARLHDTRAKTPGGLAYKLLELLDIERIEHGEAWHFSRYLLQSAAADAIEMERERGKQKADPVVLLWQRRAGLTAAYEALQGVVVAKGWDTVSKDNRAAIGAAEDLRSAVIDARCVLDREIIATTPTSREGYRIKLILAENGDQSLDDAQEMLTAIVRDFEPLLDGRMPGAAARSPDDRLLALCESWHGMKAQLDVAYSTVGDTTSTEIHDQLATLSDIITKQAPATVEGFAAQIAIVRQWHAEHESVFLTHEDSRWSDGEGLGFNSHQKLLVHRVLGHAARFAAPAAAPSIVPAVAHAIAAE